MKHRYQEGLITILITAIILIIIIVICFLVLENMGNNIAKECCKQANGVWVIANVSTVSINHLLPNLNFSNYCSVPIDYCEINLMSKYGWD
jgi:hypothetical protein